MKPRKVIIVSFLLVLTLALLGAAGSTWAQGLRRGTYFVPNSSMEHAEDAGKRVHTNYLIHERPATVTVLGPLGLPPDALRAIYGLPLTKDLVAGVNGGSGTIAIVAAYDYATAATDFDTFSKNFGLPLSTDEVCNGTHPCLKVVYATGIQPTSNCSWNVEEALDMEWAHAMAPYAQIVLVLAASSNLPDVFSAISVASNEVVCGRMSCESTYRLNDDKLGAISGEGTGEGEVSISWGGPEFAGEADFDGYFTKLGVVYVAAIGDTGGTVNYPASSPYVVSAGGTSLHFTGTASGWAFSSESAWADGGGGKSRYEPRPAYQDGITLVGSMRGTPDLSFDADPNSGPIIYDSTACNGRVGWMDTGGTSVAAPALAGILNSTGRFYSSTANALDMIYAAYKTTSMYSSDYHDITVGTSGPYSAGPGWDFTTGVGSPLTYNGK